MKKITALKITNLILFILIIIQAITGLGHNFLGEKLFEIIHPTGGALLIILVIVHIAFNWGWIKSNF
ncbi:MAG: hypothetical protein N3A64_01565 [Desulfobacterota bacterium]|nr:hypothetical protein [Thermodesulfobacteriota bacterium]